MLKVWFWQLIISPHMADLAVALARRGCKVTYVAQQPMSEDRALQGWSAPSLPGVELQLAKSAQVVQKLVQLAPADSIHICQGVRANGLVGVAQRLLVTRGLLQWVVMETVDDSGWRGMLKRAEYGRIFRARGKSLQGVLATGHQTAGWVAARGMPADRIYPFAYFLPDDQTSERQCQRKPGPFRFIFAGRLISLKRIDWLLEALARLTDQAFELWIVGAGPQEAELRTLAARKLGNRVCWLGQLPLPDVPSVMTQADCLVLPSVHDGWGAVVSEALMVGTPVICSNTCGAAGVVQASKTGGVFPVNDLSALAQLLAAQLAHGFVTDKARSLLSAWAACLGAKEGATYLQEILESKNFNSRVTPIAPWLAMKHNEFKQSRIETALAAPFLEDR